MTTLEYIVHPHPLDDACGRDPPYARIAERGGQVLLVGAPLETVTPVGHAETIARVSGKRRTEWRRPVLVDPRREWQTLHDIDTSSGAPPYERLARGVSTTSSTSPEPPSSAARGAAARSVPEPATSSRGR